MPPLEALWLVKACCVLHNRCIDWGLRKLPPGKSPDPDHEKNIQKLARRRFNEANKREADNDDADDEEHGLIPRRDVTFDGIMRRKMYIHRNYGGPRPELPRVRRGNPSGRGRGRGRGRSQSTPAPTTPRGVQKRGRGRVRGSGRASHASDQ